MKAVILAGGEGTRLRPLTSNQPKPMMPIANAPMMEHIVRLLAEHGFDDIVVTVAFMANHIRNYFGDGSEFGVRMRYATEEAPLGTAGSVRNAQAELDETFLVISGDVLTDIDLGNIVERHQEKGAFATIALKRVENPVDFGIVITKPDGTIERFLEKPTWGEVFSDTINTGTYVLEAGAVLAPYTVLGADVVVKADAHLERTVVHDHCYIGQSARLRGAVIGRGNDIREHARIEEGVVIGDECFVGNHAIVNPGVKIYPFKTVEAGALVTSSIVWESKGARTLFGRRGVRGLANVDVTSEVAVRLAMAYGTVLKKGSVVCTSRDTSRVARALKRAIIAGLNLSGVHVIDLELSTVPLTPFQVRSVRAQAGISVRLAPDDPDSVEIRFLDEDGADIDEQMQRKLERLLYREDFRRAFAGEIGDITFPPRALEFYTAALESAVDSNRLRHRSFKVVLDYSFGA